VLNRLGGRSSPTVQISGSPKLVVGFRFDNWLSRAKKNQSWIKSKNKYTSVKGVQCQIWSFSFRRGPPTCQLVLFLLPNIQISFAATRIISNVLTDLFLRCLLSLNFYWNTKNLNETPTSLQKMSLVCPTVTAWAQAVQEFGVNCRLNRIQG